MSPDKAGEYRFRLEVSDGQVVATGEAYESTAAVEDGCEAGSLGVPTVATKPIDAARYPLRPVSTLSQLATNTRSLMPFGDMSVVLLVFGIALLVADVDWSTGSVLFLILAVIGGALIEGAAAVAVAGVSVRFVDASAFRTVMDDGIDALSSYPLSIFDPATQRVLTYAVPVAFIAFLPASLVLGRTEQIAVPAALGYAAPVVGVVLFALTYRFFRSQLRHYQGVGH